MAAAALPLFHRPPSRALQLLELRAFGEFSASLALLPLLRRAPRGDGHPVLVLPGLIASDGSTLPLRSYLSDRGYEVHGWRLGRNM
ncbi:MAG: alpha/beta hydrolase, partial [Caldimonas sp.]